MSKAKFQAAKELIQQKQYAEARAILKTIDHPTARQWLLKLDKIAPVEQVPYYYAPQPPPPETFRGADSALRTQARLKSYNWAVVLVVILYLFLFIPGIFANVLLHEDAKRMERIAGQPLPGVAALGMLRKFSFLLLLLFLCAVIAVFLLPLLKSAGT